jgi:hypothetical protein
MRQRLSTRELQSAMHIQLVLASGLADDPANHPWHDKWQTYQREADQLLAEGHRGRFALIKGDCTHSIWDTQWDALQAGLLLLGEAQDFLIQKIEVGAKPAAAERRISRRPWLNDPGRLRIHYTQVADLPPGSALYRESQTYRRELPRLLTEGHEGKFALIKGEVLVGVFADEREAFAQGYAQFLSQGFMVQPILEYEPVIQATWMFRPPRTVSRCEHGCGA